MNEMVSTKAIESVLKTNQAYCKFLSANDSGETGGHQSGILISKSASEMFFSAEELRDNHILKKNCKVRWQDDFYTDSCFTWYQSKNELRLTRFGRGFPFLNPEYTGALFVLSKKTDVDYEGYVLNSEADTQAFLDAFGLTPAETNMIVETSRISQETEEKRAIDAFVNGLTVEFPTSDTMSLAARTIYYKINFNNYVISNPDKILLEWAEEEYRLFRAIEQSRYGPVFINGFDSVDAFMALANKVLNRRKSRAGKSLEHHLEAIFDGNNIKYTAQGITEGNKKPDFIFPSISDYHNFAFPTEKLCSLAAKTTCKDRWRQVLNEADRLRDHNKFLCTMQQGISSAQMDEMEAEKVILVVPKAYIASYPKDRQARIWTISKFVAYVKELQR